MSEIKSIPVPIVLKELIISNNELLTNYQRELSKKVISANIEMMQLLGLNPEDGWQLDMQEMVYIKHVENSTE
jgi:hypothetical protein